MPDGSLVSNLKILPGSPPTLLASTFGRSIYSMALPGAPAVTVIDAHFDVDAEGFTYADDAFRATAQPAYASGTRIATGSFSGGGLRVALGGIDNAVITNMSGGWSRTFDLPRSGRVQLSVRMQVTQSSEYESNELSQALVSIDGTLVGVAPNDFISQVAGDGNGGTPRTTGFQLITLDLGTRAAGTHQLTLGGFNNQKTLNDESTEILIDDVVLTLQ
jgi:hypothetical protein